MKSQIDGVIVKKLSKNVDSRGWLAEIFRCDVLDEEIHPVMAYISMTKSGESRGPHEHKSQTDLFCFLGPAAFQIYLWDNRPDSKTFKLSEKIHCDGDAPIALIVPPGVVHAYKNIGACDGLVFNAPNKLYKGTNRTEAADEIRHENISDSPFKLED
jgi:dTDP-4-dehydrorhamnose 3,5-epimerase